MTRNLALEALAQIQAIDAHAIGAVASFRTQWLGGTVLPSEEAAQAWLRDQFDAEDDEDRFWPDKSMGLPRRWVAYSTARAVRTGRTYAVQENTAPAALHEAASGIADRYGWRDYDAVLFVLCERVPTLQAVTVERETRYRLAENPPLSGPFTQTILLRCRPHATEAEVVAAYKKAQESFRENLFLAPRERIRPLTSERWRDLAVLGGRIAAGHYASWNEAMDSWLDDHPEEAHLMWAKKRDMGRFRRDVRAAFMKVTGSELIWKPVRDGTPPRVDAGMTGGLFDE